MDMMKQFYRNRHASFLQGLKEQKHKKESEQQAVRQAEEEKKKQVKQQVLGDQSRIRSKFKDGVPMKSGDDSFIDVSCN